MKILLLNDTTNWYHYGCTATSTALIDGIKKFGHCVTTVPINEIYKIKNTPQTKNQFHCSKIFNNFVDSNFSIIKQIKINDAIIINGEGTLHGINKAPLSLMYLAYIAKYKFAKHVEILNHSAYPHHDVNLSNTESVSIYELVYNTIDFASIREPISFNLMSEITDKINEGFDCLPLYIKNYYSKNHIKSEKQILVAGSAAWLEPNIPSLEKKGNIESFKAGLFGLHQYLSMMKSRGFKITFIMGAKSHPAKDDIELIEYMESTFDTPWDVYNAVSVNDWLEMIKNASLLISGRFHHTIAARCLETECIVLNSNTPKIQGIAQTLHLQEVVDYSNNTYNKLIEQTELLMDISSYKNIKYLDFLCKKASNNFTNLTLI